MARESESSSGDVCDIGRHVDMLGIWVLMEDWIDFICYANEHDDHLGKYKQVINLLNVIKKESKKLFIQIHLTTENCECHKMSQIFEMSQIFLKIYSYISI